MTSEDFLNIFYSNFSTNIDWANVDEINWMYQEGLFTLNSKVIVGNNKFLERIDLVTNPRFGLIKNGESFSHMALKSLASDYLVGGLGVKESEIKYEFNLIGFEVDVIDKALYYPVECGDTNALKLEKFLALPSTKEMLILPYPHSGDVKVFEFSRNDNFLKYIKHKQTFLNQKNSKLR